MTPSARATCAASPTPDAHVSCPQDNSLVVLCTQRRVEENITKLGVGRLRPALVSFSVAVLRL